jgi:hypothetical protein
VGSFKKTEDLETEDLETEDRGKEAAASGSFSLAGTFVPKGPLNEWPMMALLFCCAWKSCISAARKKPHRFPDAALV